MDKFCVLGKSLPHTLSPEIHGYFGLDYGVSEIEESKVEAFVKSGSFKGFNVTVPYKRAVMPYLDSISDEAKAIGAVNTVVDVNGKKCGYNTDIGGMSYALKRADIELEDKNVLILGTGGTRMVAEYLAKSKGAKSVNVVGRNSAVNYENVYELTETEVIINTTPVGMFPHAFECPIEIERFTHLEGVFDAIYNPLETEIIRRARKLNVKASNGLAMLVEQARLARDIFTATDSDVSLTEKVLDKLYKKNVNIVLVGMPSSGKSTIAKILSQRLNKQLIDLDAEICKKIGMDIETFFEKFGEKEFRKIEAEACKENSLKLGAVIATGGGTIMNEQSFVNLKRNGVMVYIDRPLELLINDGRPVSKKRGVESIFNERKSTYEKADFKVTNDRDINLVAEEIVEFYEKSISY